VRGPGVACRGGGGGGCRRVEKGRKFKRKGDHLRRKKGERVFVLKGSGRKRGVGLKKN